MILHFSFLSDIHKILSNPLSTCEGLIAIENCFSVSSTTDNYWNIVELRLGPDLDKILIMKITPEVEKKEIKYGKKSFQQIFRASSKNRMKKKKNK